MKRLTTKRNKKVNDYFHKTSKKIVEYCVINDIGTVVIGYNPDWKQNCYLGKKILRILLPFHTIN